MSDIKKFFELLASDNSVKDELKKATEEAVNEAKIKVAKAHGLNISTINELSKDELKTISGGLIEEIWGQDSAIFV